MEQKLFITEKCNVKNQITNICHLYLWLISKKQAKTKVIVPRNIGNIER